MAQMVSCMVKNLLLSSCSRWDTTCNLEFTRSSMEHKKRCSSRCLPATEEEANSSPRAERDLASCKNGRNNKHNKDGAPIQSEVRPIFSQPKHSSYVENSRSVMDRSCRNSSSSCSRFSSLSRYSSAKHDHVSYSSRGAHDRHGRSTGHLEHSPHARSGRPEHKNHSFDKSPRERHAQHDQRDRSRRNLELSSHERKYGRRERSPSYVRHSVHDRARHPDHRDQTERRSPQLKRQPSSIRDGNGRVHNECEEKLVQKESGNKDSEPNSSCRQTYASGGSDHSGDNRLHRVRMAWGSNDPCTEPSHVCKTPTELVSMEEDMDICETPPHAPDLTSGKWFYLDHYGFEQGPSHLYDLKRLVEEGVLQSDHLVKHSESDRWLTVENAASPLVASQCPSIVSETVTQLVNPPEAPGNLLPDFEYVMPLTSESTNVEECRDPGTVENFLIDERVEALMNGHTVLPGKELESVGEALCMPFMHVDWENWDSSEGFTRFQMTGPHKWVGHLRNMELGRGIEMVAKENCEGKLFATSEKDNPAFDTTLSDCYDHAWSCKGGDWKRNDDVIQDRILRRKFVLNGGYPLCQMQVFGQEDPRLCLKDDMSSSVLSQRLDLPVWAFSCPDEQNEMDSSGRPNPLKSVTARGVRGVMLPVVRINACVVRDHGVGISDLRLKGRGSNYCAARCLRSEHNISKSKDLQERELSEALPQSRNITDVPSDRVYAANELEMNLDDWYYLDSAGHEHGPFPFAELEVLAANGVIKNLSSAFRKTDQLYIPVVTDAKIDKAGEFQEERAEVHTLAMSNSFHCLYPQFIGYTQSKLHELVMKSYRSRDFAAVINEVLDLWISAKQPKKEVDKHFSFDSSVAKGSHLTTQDLFSYKFIKSVKMSHTMSDASEEDETDKKCPLVAKPDCAFEELCGEAAICLENTDISAHTRVDSWALLNVFTLARVFHFLRADFKSLAFSATTCRHWKAAAKFYKSISMHVDFSYVGSNCTDDIFHAIMNGFNRMKITSLDLSGCINVSVIALEEILRSFSSISAINITCSSQFEELSYTFKNVRWTCSQVFCKSVELEGSHPKIRSLNQLTDRSCPFSKSDIDGNLSNQEINFRKDPSNLMFHHNHYKRRKLLGSAKTSSVLSRDAHIRRLLHKKSESTYKKMEAFFTLTLQDIMKENTFSFFLPKVAEIEDRMKRGYYISHGLSCLKEDISRMCRDAIKSKNQGNAGDMNRIIMLFIQLISGLEENFKSSSERDGSMRNLRDSPVTESCSISKSKRKHSEKRGMQSSWTLCTATKANYQKFTDCEIRRHLNKLNRRSLESVSETSEDHGPSEDDCQDSFEMMVSDTESELLSGGGSGDSRARNGLAFVEYDTMDSIIDNREWGARMTKASLVPPVTRTYEVIDHYVIIADIEEVQRKMSVSLPSDYGEKLLLQKYCTEDADMDFPEVKDYKPRKRLGDEVMEQEVYGIDPYTHNLLLDSMPEELTGWSLAEKHLFIEEVILQSLNKQVRHFTGSGNTPMMYSLRPVIEEIHESAENTGDISTMRMCSSILKAMQNRLDDNYVAYRKGLGVVCNKEEGFDEDDFVVEFLGEVYPAWKWFEKQDIIRSLQKNNKDPAPEFYNIYLERPKGDRDGYDLVVVDAMHKANYASRICHSCRPNCEAKVTAVDGHYQIGIYTLRPICNGEEITFDYNSVTESKEEYEASICLCGSRVCRGSYLNLTGEGAFQKVLKECHGILDRHQLMLEACELNCVSEEDLSILGKAGLGNCLLSGLPDWLIAYSAHLVRFINFERTKLPDEILNYNLQEKRKFFSDICIEAERNDAEIQAEGVYNQRLQNLAVTLDKVRYVMRCVFGDARKAPPPLERLAPEALVHFLWKGEGSLVDELLHCIAPHMEEDLLNNLKAKIRDHDVFFTTDPQKQLKKSLLWLRDEIRKLPCSLKCRHDAAADMIHIYAYTKCFIKVRDYSIVTSEPVHISPLDLGPNSKGKMGTAFQEYRKTYGESYCLGKLINWHDQAHADPERTLSRARRGCLLLPEVGSFYTEPQKRVRYLYGPRTLKSLLMKMEKQPQKPWPSDWIWQFKSTQLIFGSPMLDAVMEKSGLEWEMVHWLKTRPMVFQAAWDG